jgi:hypothetical protein
VRAEAMTNGGVRRTILLQLDYGAKVRVQMLSAIHRFLARLGPYQAFFILAIPLAIVEPLKLVALFVIGEGHFIAGVVVMICAYVGSLFVTERLFVALKPKLLSLSWFAVAWRLFVRARNKTLSWLHWTWVRVRKVDPRF